MKRVGSESIKCTHIKYLCAFEVGMCTRRKGAPPPSSRRRGGFNPPVRVPTRRAGGALEGDEEGVGCTTQWWSVGAGHHATLRIVSGNTHAALLSRVRFVRKRDGARSGPRLHSIRSTGRPGRAHGHGGEAREGAVQPFAAVPVGGAAPAAHCTGRLRTRQAPSRSTRRRSACMSSLPMGAVRVEGSDWYTW
jgi:hypothetical protein